MSVMLLLAEILRLEPRSMCSDRSWLTDWGCYGNDKRLLDREMVARRNRARGGESTIGCWLMWSWYISNCEFKIRLRGYYAFSLDRFCDLMCEIQSGI